MFGLVILLVVLSFFSKEAAHKIFSKVKIYRWGFDSRFYTWLKIWLRVKEVPVIWENDLNSKVKFPQDLIISLGNWWLSETMIGLKSYG